MTASDAKGNTLELGTLVAVPGTVSKIYSPSQIEVTCSDGTTTLAIASALAYERGTLVVEAPEETPGAGGTGPVYEKPE